MKTTRRFVAALVTAPNLKTARKLARAALKARAAACANLIPEIESHYWWQGKLERSREILIVFKTTRAAAPRLQKIVLENHPYDTPEFVVLPIQAGAKRYLKWIQQSLAPRIA